MREPNLCFPSQSRAAVCITSALYDRRALDCTATLPLVNSLTHLAYLTSTSPRIREILCLDGGLERLVRILYQTSSRADRLTLWKWTLAFQSIVNVGVRGTEQIRTKVVDAGVIPFVLTILGNFTKSHELMNGKKETKKDSISTSSNIPKGLVDTTDRNENPTVSNNNETTTVTSAATVAAATTISSSSSSSSSKAKVLRRSTFPYIKIDPAQRRYRRIHKEKQDSKFSEIEHVFHREEDVLLCLQLLAYLSKYPHIRDLFQSAYSKNVFSVVEKFCHRLHPGPVQYWAGVIMRNACRKDETRGGIRRCANMSCGKWESQPREFAKCRRCRKAKYCSKACQSKAWADGHRWWCVERHSTVTRDNHTTTAATTRAAAAAAATAAVTAATTTPAADAITGDVAMNTAVSGVTQDVSLTTTNAVNALATINNQSQQQPASNNNSLPTPNSHRSSSVGTGEISLIEQSANHTGEGSENRSMLMGVHMEL
ncbi:MAG: hypothetical protein EXX96DRAFT_648944 [Benjaminiella poitrasii]|nr:MAG: hypothetical protein EXX96DRAFT_648944 [Benjaminiella poitrasii]